MAKNARKKSSKRRRRKRKSSKRKRSSKRSRRRRNTGRTAASRAGRELRQGSSEAGRLLGEIGEDISHEGYHRNPEVEIAEYGSELMDNPTIDYGEMARRAHGSDIGRLKRRLMK